MINVPCVQQTAAVVGRASARRCRNMPQTRLKPCLSAHLCGPLTYMRWVVAAHGISHCWQQGGQSRQQSIASTAANTRNGQRCVVRGNLLQAQ